MSDQPDHSGPLDSRGTWWVASIAIILLILAGLVAVLVWGNGGGAVNSAAPLPPTPTASTAAPTTSSAAPQPAGGCNPPATDQTVPKAAPANIQWSLVNTVALPWSPTAGATKRDGDLWTCYAHTPTGALVAAAVLSVTPYGPGAERVLSSQVLPGPERDARLATVQAQPPQPNEPGTASAVAGFKFLDYSMNRATIQIAFAYASKSFVWTVPLEWSDGDWKLNLDPSGGSVAGQPITNLAGYIGWGAK